MIKEKNEEFSMGDKIVLNVYDEEYLMWTLLVNEDRFEEISEQIQERYDSYYANNDDGEMEDQYGNYSAYVEEFLNTLPEDVTIVRYEEMNL